jgi:vacuolar iron transporter family protein
MSIVMPHSHRANHNLMNQMVSKLEMKGMSRSDAELVVGKFALYEDVFVNFLLVEELGMNLPDEDDGASLLDAFVMLIAYAIFGSIPVGIFAMGIKFGDKEDTLFLASTIVTTVLLAVLGSVKSTFSSSNWIFTAAETLFTTSLCALAAYSLAYAIADLLGEYI